MRESSHILQKSLECAQSTSEPSRQLNPKANEWHGTKKKMQRGDGPQPNTMHPKHPQHAPRCYKLKPTYNCYSKILQDTHHMVRHYRRPSIHPTSSHTTNPIQSSHPRRNQTSYKLPPQVAKRTHRKLVQLRKKRTNREFRDDRWN